MVKVSDYKVRTTKTGRSFIALDLIGGLEMVFSKTTNSYYAAVKRCSIPTSIDEQTAKLLIGSELAGEIVKQPAEPYEFVTANNEKITLDYTYVFVPEIAKTVQQAKVLELEMDSGKTQKKVV